MSFLAPAALWLAVVGLGIVALYLLKIKRRRQTVPSLEFWRELANETPVRSLFQQLKRWLSLLLWLVTAACLVLAVGNPIITAGRMKAESIVIIVDNSAGMQTVEQDFAGRTRFQLAQQVVVELINKRPVNDEWLLVDAGRQPRVAQAFSRDRKSLRDAAIALEPFWGGNDLPAAVKLASQLLAEKSEPRIVVISDGADGAVAKLMSEDERLVHWPIGKTSDNLGITRMSVRIQRSRSEHHVFLQVMNASPDSVETNLVFDVDGTTTKVEPLNLAPGELWEKVVEFYRPEGGVLRASIDRDDALPVDNEVFAVLKPIEPAAVFLVTDPEESYFFEQALMAMESLVDFETSQILTPEQYTQLGTLRDEADLTIFNNAPPENGTPVGPALFVNRWPEDLPAQRVGDAAATRMEVAWADHPLMRHLNFRAATLALARSIELLDNKSTAVLARSADGAPLIFLDQTPEHRALCLAFNVLDSDLPFRNSFPILLRNAVTYFVSEQTPWVLSHYRIGESIESLRPIPDDVTEVMLSGLQSEGMTADVISVRQGRFRFDATHRPGPLRFLVGEEYAYTAVNLTDAHESRIAPVPPVEPVQSRLMLSDQLAGTIPWLALACAGMVLIAVEWLTYHFRWTE